MVNIKSMYIPNNSDKEENANYFVAGFITGITIMITILYITEKD